MKASVVIPAYNEELTIENVIDACRGSLLIDEIIVVNDGSEDKTALLAEKAGAQVLSYGKNMGKAYAIVFGAKHAKNNVLLLLDADLLGLSTKHVESLILPVLTCKAPTTVGLFSKGRMKTDLAHSISPWLSGQRCIRKEYLDEMKSCEEVRYGFEVKLNSWMKKNNIAVTKVSLDHVSHLTKEEKRGKKAGFSNRMKMYEEIMSHLFKK
jgi:glycosyltransferase involved in cell wall biosynthesis